MAAATLTISSKNYSSWSLRGWLLCRMAKLDFEERVAPLADPSTRAELLLLSPSFLVPCLDHNEAKVWDTLTTLAHPDVFARLIEDQRREQDSAKRMKNDDVTLMRLRMLAGQPAYLLACR